MANALLNLLMRHSVHLASRLPDQEPEHLRLGHQLHERELDALIQREGFPERCARSCVGDAFADAEGCGAEAGGCLSDAVFVQESLGDGEAAVDWAEDGTGGNEDVGE